MQELKGFERFFNWIGLLFLKNYSRIITEFSKNGIKIDKNRINKNAINISK